MALPPEKRQGYLGNLDEKSVTELEELLSRQEGILKNRKFLNTLGDKGRKVEEFAARLRAVINKKNEIDAASLQFDRMTIADDEESMTELHKLGKKISTRSSHIVKTEKQDHVNKMEGYEVKSSPKDLYHPNRTLRVGTVSADMIGKHKKEAMNIAEYQPKKEEFGEIIIPQFDKEAISQLEQQMSVIVPFELRVVDLADKNILFIVYDLQSNGIGPSNTEICQLVAVGPDREGFNRFCVPPYLSKQVSNLTGLKIEYKSGQRLLTKHAEPVETVDKFMLLKDFKKFVDEIQTRLFSENDNAAVILCTNSMASQNILMYNFKTSGLYPPCVYYACLTPLLKSLQMSGKIADSSLTGAYSSLFNEKLNIHNAKLRCDSVRKILFDSNLRLSADEIVSGFRTVDCAEANRCLDFILEKRKRVNSMRGKLFDFSMKSKNVISESIADSIAAAGLTYSNLERYYKLGEQAFTGILVLPGTGTNGRPRVTDDLEVLKALVSHFHRKINPTKYEGALESIQDHRSVHLPLNESIELQIQQKANLDEIAVKHAAERLVNPIAGVGKMVRFNPEGKNPSQLVYREVKDDSDSDDNMEAID